jgi:hypothetical protein
VPVQPREVNDVTASVAERQRAAEITRRYPGWIVWTARKGTPVATRSGNQRPPAKDGVWAQTIIADDWTQLEEQLAVQAQHDAERTDDIAS